MKNIIDIVMLRSIKNRWIKLTLMVIRIYFAILILLYFYQEKFVFHPSSTQWNSCALQNGELKTIDATFNSSQIRAIIKEDTQPKLRIILFHGNAGSACDRLFWREYFSGIDTQIVFAEYPGYDGTPFNYQQLLQRSIDTFDYFSKLHPLSTLIIGESIGTGVATYLSSKRKVDGLLLFAPYPSLSKVAQDKLPLIPISLLLSTPFPSEEWAQGVSANTLAFHGSMDKVIPLHFGKEQISNFKNGELFVIESAGHNDWTEFVDDKFNVRIKSFLSTFL